MLGRLELSKGGCSGTSGKMLSRETRSKGFGVWCADRRHQYEGEHMLPIVGKCNVYTVMKGAHKGPSSGCCTQGLHDGSGASCRLSVGLPTAPVCCILLRRSVGVNAPCKVSRGTSVVIRPMVSLAQAAGRPAAAACTSDLYLYTQGGRQPQQTAQSYLTHYIRGALFLCSHFLHTHIPKYVIQL